MSTLDDKISSCEIELEELKKRATTVRNAIDALQDKIKEIGGAKLMAQRSKVDSLRTFIGIANTEITNAEVTKEKAAKDAKKHASAIESNNGVLEDAQTEADRLNEDFEELQSYVARAKEVMEDAKAAEENSKEDLEQLKQELDEKTETIQAFRKKEVCANYTTPSVQPLTLI